MDDDRRPLIIGHRGAPNLATENTPASFAAAARVGADWVEMDARLTADGEVVVHHDPILADGRRIIDLGVVACEAAGVSTLGTVLRALPDGLGVDLEIKNFPDEPDHDETMAVVTRCGQVLTAVLDDRPVVVTSFNPMVLVAAAGEGFVWPTGLLTFTTTFEGGLKAARELACGWVCPHHTSDGLSAQAVASAHDANLSVMVWTVDDAELALELSAAGVDALCTNDPGLLATVVQASSGD